MDAQVQLLYLERLSPLQLLVSALPYLMNFHLYRGAIALAMCRTSTRKPHCSVARLLSQRFTRGHQVEEARRTISDAALRREYDLTLPAMPRSAAAPGARRPAAGGASYYSSSHTRYY